MLAFMTWIISFQFNMVKLKMLMVLSINFSTKKTFKDILVCNCYAEFQNCFWLSIPVHQFSDLGAGSGSIFFKTDLAIITLNHRFALTHKINPICLPIRRNGIVKFTMNNYMHFTVTGWGHIRSILKGQTIEHLILPDPTLRQAKVYTVPYEKCYEMWHGVKIPEHLTKMSKFQKICFE